MPNNKFRFHSAGAVIVDNAATALSASIPKKTGDNREVTAGNFRISSGAASAAIGITVEKNSGHHRVKAVTGSGLGGPLKYEQYIHREFARVHR